MTEYALFLDDNRDTGTALPPYPLSWIIARSYGEAVQVVEELGFPKYVSFDHDLGDMNEKTGYDFAQYLVLQDMDHRTMPEGFSFFVHSCNPVGKMNIETYLNNYLNFKRKG